MAPSGVEGLDTTLHTTNEWLRDIAREIGNDNRRFAYLALRGTLHAVRDFLSIDESAQLSAQLPLLVRGIYFEGWNPAHLRRQDRSRERFLAHVETAMERALWNEEYPIDTEEATRAVLRILSDRISEGEMDQIRQAMPARVRELWPQASVIG